jgi:hypothetical protein
MQKKSSENSNVPSDGIIISLEDLNSEISIRNWIKNKLKHSDPNLSSDQIKSALNGIIRDPAFIEQPEDKKTLFMNSINQLVKSLK